MSDKWFRLNKIPDLTLNKYSSLGGKGVEGVLEKHISFLRQLNRKGIVSNLSFHLYYLYISNEDRPEETKGNRLQVYLQVRGNENSLNNILNLISASPLSSYYDLEEKFETEDGSLDYSIWNELKHQEIYYPMFNTCSILTKTETTIETDFDNTGYYILKDWEMNDEGRLYNMVKMMESLDQTACFRIDLYPVEKTNQLRNNLKRPISTLRDRQDSRENRSRRDYEGRDVLRSYEDLIDKFESSPQFIMNMMVFANSKEDTTLILDAAGSEGLTKGKYSIATFNSNFHPLSFLDDSEVSLENFKEKFIVKKGRPGLIVCKESTADLNLNYLPTLFTLEEVTPFFRLPALYDGESIEIPKETSPKPVSKEGSLFLGLDKNGYEVNFPLKLLPKHAFISGVPGSGKTNTMHHITSSLWKDHKIPFLVLEPAKQEYRALLNDPEMKDVYLFSPNADMSFPLHINPFEMPKGTLIAEHISLLGSVFEGAFPLDPPMPFLLDTAIESVYRQLGWLPEDIYTGEEKKDLPTMSMLYNTLEKEINSTKYDSELRGNLESALKVRIGSLMRREMGDIFDVPKSTFKPEDWLKIPAIIELESMGSGPANFLTLMLSSLIRSSLKVDPNYGGDVRHVLFIEEAHNLIGPESEEQAGENANPKIAATAFIVKMLAEVRALKEGIFITDQIPTKMAQEVLKNTGLKLGLRLTASDDREALGSTMAANNLQLEEMATFPVGQALIFYEDLLRPFNISINEWKGEIKDKDQKELLVTPKNDVNLRNALLNNRSFREINDTSVSIIGSKYSRQFDEIKTDIDSLQSWLNTLGKIENQLRDLNQRFINIELGKEKVSDQEKNELYNRNDDLISKRDILLKSISSFKNYTETLDKLIRWFYDLERLKNNRWKRFGLTDIQIGQVELLQTTIAIPLIEIFSKSYKYFKSREEVKQRENFIKEAKKLVDSFNKENIKKVIDKRNSEI